MFDAGAVAKITSGATAGWATFAIVLVAVIRAWPAIMAKVNEARNGEAQIAGEQYKRLLEWCDRLEARVEALEEEAETYRRERDEARAEVMKWQAIAEGVGANRQEGAVRSAVQRLEDKGGG